MISNNFAHDLYSTVNQKSPYFEWDFREKKNSISFYIDGDIVIGIKDKKDGKIKFLWTLESPFFNNNVFDFIKKNLSEVLETYEMIFTYDDSLLKLSDKFKWIPAMGSWIKTPKIHKKTKKVSMILSNKTYTPQQKMRLEFAKNNSNNIDLFGRAFKELKEKDEGLRDYMFSVCIENAIFDTYFTEKVLDCFSTGTIPIYSGTNNLNKYFDEMGIIYLNKIEISSLNYDYYISKLSSVEKNFELVQNYLLPENFLYKNYLNHFF
jgi:hypothetical protein